ncbi:beat-Ic, partial [Drosophila busckii]
FISVYNYLIILVYNKSVCVCVFVCILADFIVALKDVSVMIPQAVKRGSNALFICNYDMENDTLYSVKWYKGKREFYRYTPKENPAMKVFAMTSGLNVERNLSNQSHVVLQSVPLNISGKFTCEISVEAPTFQTAMVSGEMEVVELPEEHTVVTGIQARYRIGDLVDANCSIKYSKPAANLTWTINGIVVSPHHIKTYQIEKQENSTLESVMSAVHFMVTNQHFNKGQMKLKCASYIFDIFKEEIENVIEEDRPRILASGRSYDMDHGHGKGEHGYEDHNESYLKQSDRENKGSSGASTSIHKVFWSAWLLKIVDALPLQQIIKLCRHINRQLLETWTWLSELGALTPSTMPAVCSGSSILAAIPLGAWWWSHRIINCQYGSDKAATQEQQQQSSTSDSDCDCDAGSADDVDLTMSKATTASDKCFYNCQMALATLWRWQAEAGNTNLDQSVKAAAADDDDDNDDDENIASVAMCCDDLTAPTVAAAAAAAIAKRRLSATLAKVGVPASLDQRLLMTWQALAAELVTISC